VDTFHDLVKKTRTFRRFVQEATISVSTLEALIDLARLAGSARNAQPLKYMPVADPALNAKIFPFLGWAGYLADWPGPAEGERPAAYIICLLDTRICEEADCDLGIATQNMLLGATDRGLGGCRIGAFSPGLRQELALPDHLRILLVVALGKPLENVVIDEAGEDGDIRYWRDEERTHHVPKRSLAEIIIPSP